MFAFLQKKTLRYDIWCINFIADKFEQRKDYSDLQSIKNISFTLSFAEHLSKRNTHFFTAKQSYYLPETRTIYGIFNIRFQCPAVWNSVDKNIKSCSIAIFKFKLKQSFLDQY